MTTKKRGTDLIPGDVFEWRTFDVGVEHRLVTRTALRKGALWVTHEDARAVDEKARVTSERTEVFYETDTVMVEGGEG